MNEENIKAEFEQTEKEIEENYQKAIEILRDHFKILYDDAGMEWSKEDDESISFVARSICVKAVMDSGKAMIEALHGIK
jgi:hypothetical protein